MNPQRCGPRLANFVGTMRFATTPVSALLFASLSLVACSSSEAEDDAGDEKPDAAAPHGLEVQVGVPDPQDDLEFLRLEHDGDIELGTFGQGGTHALLAVRCIGFGSQAFVDVSLTNLETDKVVMTLPSKRPQLLICREQPEAACDYLPIILMTGGLADPDEKDGLHVRVTAEVHNEAGKHGTASEDGYLRKNL